MPTTHIDPNYEYEGYSGRVAFILNHIDSAEAFLNCAGYERQLTESEKATKEALGILLDNTRTLSGLL